MSRKRQKINFISVFALPKAAVSGTKQGPIYFLSVVRTYLRSTDFVCLSVSRLRTYAQVRMSVRTAA